MAASDISQDCIDDIARATWRMEAALDEALVRHAHLTRLMVQAQSEGRLSSMTLHHDVFARLPDVSAGIIQSRGAVVELHRGIGAAGKRLGLSLSALVSPPEDKDVGLPQPTGLRPEVVSMPRRAG